MKKYFDGLAILMASAWVGGMWVVGYVVAPVLFHSLQDRALAGMLAGKLFAVMAYISMVCAIYLLFYAYKLCEKKPASRHIFLITLVMLLFTLFGQFGMQPLLAEIKAQALPLYVMDSPYADRFKFWHGVSSIVYLVQSLSGAFLLLKVYRSRS